MSDFITLACPSCGGMLRIDPKNDACLCDYCGTRHILRDKEGRGLLETFNACPVCHRNDQVKKYTAVVATRPSIARRSNISRSPNQPTYIEDYRPPPKASKHPVVNSIILGSIGIGLIIFAIFAMITGDGLNTYFYCLNAIIAAFGIGFILVGNFNYRYFKGYPEILMKYEKKVSEITAINAQRRADYEKEVSIWEEAQSRLNFVYYCERDDIVFIPGEDKYFDVMNLESLLYQVLD